MLVAKIDPDSTPTAGQYAAHPAGLVPENYRVVVALPVVREKKGSLLLPQTAIDTAQDATMVGRLVAVGPGAFQGKRFEHCEPIPLDSFVVFPAFAGNMRLVLDETDGNPHIDVRIISDETIQAVISRPELVSRK